MSDIGQLVRAAPDQVHQQRVREVQSSAMQAAWEAAWKLHDDVLRPATEQDTQDTINRKNYTNYARWLARITREPLNDCEAK